MICKIIKHFGESVATISASIACCSLFLLLTIKVFLMISNHVIRFFYSFQATLVQKLTNKKRIS